MKPVEQLAQWVALKHAGQMIKGTADPYFLHLQAVANLAKGANALGYEIGLCHDLLEDTDTTVIGLREALMRFGYTEADAVYITGSVVELTDVFTASAYPDLAKKDRKAKEAARLAGISPGAQTIKYGDLIDNIRWVLRYDRKLAAAYLKKKQALLDEMKAGDPKLHRKALVAIREGMESLNELTGTFRSPAKSCSGSIKLK